MTTEPVPPVPTGPTHERRIAVLPLVIAGAVLAVLLAGSIGVASLALRPQAEAPLQQVAPPVEAPPPSPAPAESATPEPLPAAGPNQCRDHVGDAVFDLASVDLEPGRRGAVIVRFQLAGEPPGGAAALSLLAEGSKETYRFSAELREGRVEAYRVLEVGDEDDDDRLDRSGVTIEGSSIVMVLPQKLVKRLGTWSWAAFTSVGGILDDSCGEGLVPYRMG